MSKNYIIMTDVNSDLSYDLRRRFNIEYIEGHITLPGGKELTAKLEWDFTTEEEFYPALKKTAKKVEGKDVNNNEIYTTSPASPEEYSIKFQEYAKSGYDVLCLCISTALSGTYQFATQGAKLAQEKYPNAKFIVIDTQRYSNGIGLIAMYASLNRDKGMTIEENRDWILENRNRFHQMGWLDDLSFVASKGRLTHSKAFFGQLIGIKPIGDFDTNGMITVIGKAKGKKSAFDAIIKYMKETIENPEDQIIFMAETNRKKDTLEFKKLIEENIKPKEIIINSVFASCGINVGPGLMAAYYVGKPTSDGLVTEKELFQNILNEQ